MSTFVTFTVISLPLGAVYVVESPTFRPRIAWPSGLDSGYTSMSLASSAISRLPSRKVLESPAMVAVTTVPTSTTPWLSGASPTVALRSSCVS